jgi:O-antigen ligase
LIKEKVHYIYLNSYKNIIIISIIAVSLFLILQYLSFFLLGVIILTLLYIKFKENFILLVSILTYLLLTTEIADTFRNYINLVLFLTLLILFITYNRVTAASFGKFPGEINFFILLTLFSLTLSALFSESILESFIPVLRQIIFFAVVYIFFSFIKDIKTVNLYIKSLLAVGVVLSLSVFYQVYTMGFALYSVQTETFTQFSGFYIHHNAVGLLLAVSIPFSIPLFFLPENRSAKRKFLLGLIFILSFAALLLTNSRSCILSVAVSLFFFLVVRKSRLLKYIFTFLIVLILAIIAIPQLNDFFATYFRVGSNFETMRSDIWAMTFDMIRNNFWLGVGAGLFETKIYTYLPVELGSYIEKRIWISRSGTSHNFFLFRFAEGGILGFTVGLLMVSTFLKIGIRALKFVKEKEPYYYIIVISILSVGLGLFTRAFFESTGLLTNGWITRDLPFWLCFISLIFIYKKFKPVKRV